MSVQPELRQRLLELVYDLLGDDEAAELRARIDADPELAEAYAEAQQAAGLFQEAARLETPRITLRRPEKPVTVPFVRTERSEAPRPKPLPRPRPGSSSPGPWSRWANRAIAIAASVLLIISLSGYLYHRGQMSEVAADRLRILLAGPSRLQAGTANRYAVTTTSVSGRPVSAQIEFALSGPDGHTLLDHKEKTDENGRLELVVPAELSLPPQASLQVCGILGDKVQRIDTQLEVLPPRAVTQLAVDKPLYQPAETVRYRSLTLSRFGLAVDREFALRFLILDPRGAVLPGSEREGTTDRGVGCGEFAIPANLAGGEYTLLAKSQDGSFPDERRRFFVRGYRLPRLKKELEFARDSYGPGEKVVADFAVRRAEGGPAAAAKLTIVATVDGKEVHKARAETSAAGTYQVEFTLPREIEHGDGQLLIVADDGGSQEPIAKTLPINLGKFRVAFYPEGGELVAGLENRVYFTARDPLGKPVAIRGRLVDRLGHRGPSVETTHEGMGVFAMTPVAGESYRLKIDSPAGATEEPALPAVIADPKVVLTTGLGVFDSKRPLEFVVRAAEPGLPLVAAATCRGVLVGQQPFVTQVTAGTSSNSVANAVAIPLDDSAGGVIRLTVYDYRATPPRPLAERLVYRRPARKLDVQVAEHPRGYSPGERVDLRLEVKDEAGNPAPAALGVSVVDETLLNLAQDKAGSMTTHFLLATEVEHPEDLEKIDFYLSDDPKAAVALDLLLGTQGWRRFVEKTLQELKNPGEKPEDVARLVAMGGLVDPPAVFDNLDELKRHYQTNIDTYRANRTRVINALVTVSFFGAAGLVLFVAMLNLMSIPCGVRGWGVSLSAAAVCLVLGLALLNPAWDRGLAGDVAFATFHLSPPKPAEVAAAEAPAPEAMMGPGPAAEEAAKAEPQVDAFKADAAELQLAQELKEAEAGEAARRLDRFVRKPVPFGALARDKAMGGMPGAMPRAAMPAAAAPAAPGFAMGEMGGGMAARQGLAGPARERRAFRKEKLPEAGEVGFVVREYRHESSRRPDGPRRDFAETLYWHPLLFAGADGHADIHFDLADSVTSYRVLVDAHTNNGRLGTGTGTVISRIPFNLEAKLPLEVNAGDRIDLPLAVVNDTAHKLPVEVTLTHGEQVRLDGESRRQRELAAGQRSREYFGLAVVAQKGDCKLTFRGEAEDLEDAVERTLHVVPPGFPTNLSFAGQIDGSQDLVVRLPPTWVPGSLEVELNAFPSTLASIQKGMEGMLQEPSGCFEQASSSNYPNVLTLSYLQEHNLADPAIMRRARELLKSGYGKLTAFESPNRGYEWFGGDPGHEALTAYGLLEFRDMARVYEVDPAMIARTAKWILDRRDGKGGFLRNAKALDAFGAAPQDITDAYITWALAEANPAAGNGTDGAPDLAAEVSHAIALADKSDDPYLVALAAGAAIQTGRETDGRKLLDKLGKTQAQDGRLEGKNGSITRSGGQSLAVETTALAALAWLKLPDFSPRANRAVEWLTKARQGSGGFGSTQATVLALKALTQHAKANRRVVSDGKLIVRRGESTVYEQPFRAGRQEAIRVDGLDGRLEPGENRLKIELTGDNKLPYALNVAYRSAQPVSDEACPVRLKTRLAQSKLKAGATVAMEAELTNATDKGQPMTVAILGLPAGLEVRPDQLEDLKKAGTIDAYETRRREVIFYWRSLAPKKQVACKLDLIAAVPGQYTGPASRAYLYYTAEQKQWAQPLRVEIERE